VLLTNCLSLLHLLEQYDAFVKFNYDQVQRRFQETAPTCEYKKKVHFIWRPSFKKQTTTGLFEWITLLVADNLSMSLHVKGNRHFSHWQRKWEVGGVQDWMNPHNAIMPHSLRSAANAQIWLAESLCSIGRCFRSRMSVDTVILAHFTGTGFTLWFENDDKVITGLLNASWLQDLWCWTGYKWILTCHHHRYP